MKCISTFLFFVTIFSSFAYSDTLNLDFESIKEEKPVDWNMFGSDGYITSITSDITQHGKQSVFVEYDGNSPEYGGWSYSIPAKYQGEKIKLTGYIKTENVSNGFAGLWMRIDPSIALDNMSDRGITGTTDWRKYEITLDLKTSSAKSIVIGGLLAGKGKVWFDNFEVFIDDTAILDAPLKEVTLAELDKEFDNGSTVNFPALNNKHLANLDLLGKIWGFLKYHHPAIAKAKYNWDYELIRILPKYLSLKTNEERDDFLLNWIATLGKVAPCITCSETASNAFHKPELSWIKKHQLSLKLESLLNYIYQNRTQGEHYYVGSASDIGNAEFKNENPYANMPYPDAAFRLIALYRYWNMIHYYYPYKHLMDKNWNDVLYQYIKPFVNAKNELEYELTTLQLIGDVQDTHAIIWGGNDAFQQWIGKYYPPINVRMIENKLVIIDYYNPEMQEKVGLKIGDVITKINGINVAELITKRLPFYPASNYPTQLRDLAPDLLRSNSSFIEVSYVKEFVEQSVKLDLYEKKQLDFYQWYRKEKNGESFKVIDNNIGYITLKNIKNDDIKKIKHQLKNTDGIIIDIRNYPSTFVPYTLGSFFTATPSKFVKFTKPNFNNPGEFNFQEALEIPASEDNYEGKLIVLVNELSQSQAEFTAMAFRAGNNTTIIGSTTAGADGDVSQIKLPGNLSTMISGKGAYYPDGTETQRVGIIPDIEVKPTINGIKSGRDELIEFAIDIIKSTNQKLL
ncbi:S41 family peptidase [Colwelliaceae bacterium BS250]